MLSEYRVSYGNGQVSEGFSTKRHAQRHIDEAANVWRDPYWRLFRIQGYDPSVDEWFALTRPRDGR